MSIINYKQAMNVENYSDLTMNAAVGDIAYVVSTEQYYIRRSDGWHPIREAIYSRRVQTDSSGNATITFPSGMFASGVVPIITLTPELSSGSNEFVMSNVSGTPSNVSVTIRTRRVVAGITLVLGNLTGTITVPTQAWVHVTAYDPRW